MRVHAAPNAKKSEIVGIHGDALKIKIKAPPVDGKANEEIIRFFSELCGVPQSRVTLTSGQSSKTKSVLIADLKENPLKIPN